MELEDYYKNGMEITPIDFEELLKGIVLDFKIVEKTTKDMTVVLNTQDKIDIFKNYVKNIGHTTLQLPCLGFMGIMKRSKVLDEEEIEENVRKYIYNKEWRKLHNYLNDLTQEYIEKEVLYEFVINIVKGNYLHDFLNFYIKKLRNIANFKTSIKTYENQKHIKRIAL